MGEGWGGARAPSIDQPPLLLHHGQTHSGFKFLSQSGPCVTNSKGSELLKPFYMTGNILQVQQVKLPSTPPIPDNVVFMQPM